MQRLQVKLKIRGPVLTAGVGSKRIGVDVNQLRNGLNNPIISGTHIKGRLKFSILQILLAFDGGIYAFPSVNVEEKDKINKQWMSRLEHIFGAPDEYSSPVTVQDFILLNEQIFPIKNRIAILRDTGIVKEGALAFLEGGKQGREFHFSGTILLPPRGSGGLNLEELKNLIIYGFLWLDCIGSQNTIGWGKVIGREIENPTVSLETLADKLKSFDYITSVESPLDYAEEKSIIEWKSIGLVIKLKSPLLVSDHSPKGNFFEGRNDVPGSVLKRAMADQLLLELGIQPGQWINEELIEGLNGKDYNELIKGMSSIFIRFAFPINPCIFDMTKEVDRPVPLPLTSFVYKGWESVQGEPWDILVKDIQNKGYLTRIHEKRIVFKSDTPSLNGWLTGYGGDLFAPQHFIHTRTAIDNITLASEEAKLFSYRAVSDIYQKENGEKYQQVYLSEIVFPKSEDLKKQILQILNKIRAIGKASRHGLGQVEFIEVEMKRYNWKARLGTFNDLIKDDKLLVPIMLATEAVLLEPFKVQLDSNLKDMYENTWKNIFGQQIRLRTFYVQHKLRGIRKGKQGVPPVVLTDAGSVFVLEMDKDKQTDAEAILSRLSNFGVEINSYLLKIDEVWKSFCPYRRTNGYGEVVICHPIHLEGVPHGDK